MGRSALELLPPLGPNQTAHDGPDDSLIYSSYRLITYDVRDQTGKTIVDHHKEFEVENK